MHILLIINETQQPQRRQRTNERRKNVTTAFIVQAIDIFPRLFHIQQRTSMSERLQDERALTTDVLVLISCVVSRLSRFKANNPPSNWIHFKVTFEFDLKIGHKIECIDLSNAPLKTKFKASADENGNCTLSILEAVIRANNLKV